MRAVVLDCGARYAPAPQHGRLHVSDWDLVRHLRARDGEPPRRAPSHAPRGRCKYQRYYPDGDCPWCRASAA